MNPLRVVVELNIFEYVLPGLVRVVIVGIMNKLSFQRTVERFHNSIVIRISFTTHALAKAIAHQCLGDGY